MSEELRRADEAARRAALDPRRSILLQAPAGSGKTGVLVRRYLRLLCTVDEPGEVLAITFTRKAAAEMHARVLASLRGERRSAEAQTEEVRELAAAALRHAAARGWQLTEDPQLLRIQTIDSFNYWLASLLPLASRAGGALSVTETPQELYRRAARRTLAAAEADAELSADAELWFERLDNRWQDLEGLLAGMLARRAHWLPYVLGEEPLALCARVNQSLAALIGSQLAQACALLPAAVRCELEALPEVGKLGAATAQLPGWQALATAALTRDGATWRRVLSEHHLGSAYAAAPMRARLKAAIELLQGIPPARALLAELRRLPPAALSDADAQALAALSRLLLRAASELQTEFAAAGSVDYSYVSGAARAALGDATQPTDLALRTGLALRHILVDEFQDTSIQQFELLKTLTASWEPGDGRSLFLVGDPMQSIYRFRDAEVGLFIAARDCGVGQLRLEPLKLTRNFRAVAELVHWSNAVFAQVFPPADDLRSGSVTFAESLPARGASLAQALELRLFTQDRPGEVRAVTARIAALRAADPQASIAVLVTAHAHATPIVAALHARGIEALGVDLVPLAERAVVRDLVQLGCALHDLADRSAWLAVLRAPWCGVRLTTLTALTQRTQLLWEALHDEALLGPLPADERARVLRVRAVLEGALARRARQPLAAWLESTWLGLGAADAYGAQDLSDAEGFFAALAASASGASWAGPRALAPLLHNLCSQGQPAGPNPVQIMTVHRAKGLEFDHVLVPALERPAGRHERALLNWIDLPRHDGGSELFMAPVPPVGPAQEEKLTRLVGRWLEARAAQERARLAYVAVTRARQTLWLSAAPKARRDGTLTPQPRSLLHALWPALAERFAVAASPPGPQEGVGATLAPLRRLRSNWQSPRLPATTERWQLPLVRGALEVPEFSWVSERQRHIGTIVHAWLAQLADREPLPQAAAVEALRPQLLEELRLAGVAAVPRPEAAELILTALRRTLGDERGRWILAPGHRSAHSELALTGVADGRLRSVKVDRSFIAADGTRWVIDYKTSRHEGADLEGFLEQELERYRAQLTTYAALARELGPEQVRAGLYFPLLGAFRELP